MKVVQHPASVDLTTQAEAFIEGIKSGRVTEYALVWYEQGVQTPYFSRVIFERNTFKIVGVLEMLKHSLLSTFCGVNKSGEEI